MNAAFYQPPTHGIPVGRLLRRALFSHDVLMKQAAQQAGLDDATLSRGVNALGPLDLNRIVALDFETLFHFFRLILAAKLAQWETESIEDTRREA